MIIDGKNIPLIKFTDDTFTDGFLIVSNPSIILIYRRILRIIDEYQPSIILIFFVVEPVLQSFQNQFQI